MKSRRQIRLDLVSTLQGPFSDFASGSAAGSVTSSGPGSIDLFSEVDPEVSTPLKSTSPS